MTDQAGAAVPGATVTVIADRTRFARTSVSGSAGDYVVPGLAPGSYQVRVELTGFRALNRDGIGLATGETLRLDLRLSVGALNESVTVTADAPLLREVSGLGQVIDNRKVIDLPLNGRSFITLAGLVAGVALPPASQLPRINGGRPRTSDYLFDGISVLQPEPGQVAFFPNIDFIQEFKIESNSPPAGCRPSTIPPPVARLAHRSPATPFRSSASTRWRALSSSAIPCLPVPARRTTIDGWTTRRSIRIS